MDKSVFINYFKGDLSEEEEKNLIAWLDESEANREELLHERELWDLLLLNSRWLNEAKGFRLKASGGSEILQEENLSASATPNKSYLKRQFIQIGKVAAILLIAFGAGFLFKTLYRPQDLAAKINTIDVPTGQRVFITLTDGTKVWLNSKTRFSFPDRFDKDNRSVQLNGEALFDVVHNEKAPFVVNTSKYQAKVFGTQFDMYAYRNSSTFETTLVEGKVMLKANNSGGAGIELQPDEQFSADTLTHKSEIHKVATTEYTSWIDGVYSFNDQSFSLIMQQLERYYETKIVVNYPELLDFRFTGKFRYSDPLTVILDVVKKSKPFSYRQVGNNIIINK